MLFNTFTYLVFLPLVFIVYWGMARSKKEQNWIIVLSSFVFYGWWDVKCLFLMIATCTVNYVLVKLMERKDGIRKGLLYIAIILDFCILGTFKYFNFFADNLEIMLESIGIKADFPTLNIILPVGVSFYTFQLVGYVIDCYKRKIQVPHSFVDFIAFICFFPQLVAGPIERGNTMLAQLVTRRNFDFNQGREGMRLILWGLVKKMLIADNCAVVVNYVFDNYTDVSLPDLWIGALCFTFQIYGDFSGYSDIAIGSAALLGVKLSTNFMKPFFSQDIPAFWRRWHITLMSWFKDYVYIPLGGSHRGVFRKHVNRTTVFLLSGLWHGSNWTFVAWGLYNALWFLIPHKWLTFIIVMIGFVIFRSPDIHYACDYITNMFTPSLWGATTCSRMPLFLIAAFALVEWLMRDRQHPFSFSDKGLLAKQWVRIPLYIVIFLSVVLLGGESSQFIYFQF